MNRMDLEGILLINWLKWFSKPVSLEYRLKRQMKQS